MTVVLEDWFSFAGTEIANKLRAITYAAAHGIQLTCPPCPTLLETIGSEEYTNPVDDDAPWHDPGMAESQRVLGFYVLGTAGWDDTGGRQPIPRARDGSLIGHLRNNHREIAFTIAVVALDECALSFGKAWLSATLRGSACGTGACHGDTLCFLACCPCRPPAAGAQWGDAEARYVYDVGMLDPLREIDRMYVRASGCYPEHDDGPCEKAVIATCTFAMVAGRPHVYRHPVEHPTVFQPSKGTVTKNFSPLDWERNCKPPALCGTDPDCKPVPPLPGPPRPHHPCYWDERSGDWKRYDVWLVQGKFSAFSTSETLESTVVITATTTTKPLKKLLIRFIPNPADLPCDQVDSCAACNQILIPYIPPRSTAVIDGRTESATVRCEFTVGFNTGPIDVLGTSGDALIWPVFTCGNSMCVDVIAQTDSDPNATVTIALAQRQNGV
ncbi:hypothetical protein ACMATS_05840 [Streptoverticillium reticulum]|uniref:hypothetical protein n=1 Tax=Streptoverticillium reticulum TaxID=1433415 RepID=UPI0039BF8D45